MSKKSRLILATALFGAALFGASCGGGGGGTTAGGGSGGSGGGGGGGVGGTQPPPATEEGKVLALLNVGSAGAGAVKPVAICKLMSDNKADCGNDLNPNADLDLEYVYEFGNGNVGNVVLKAGSTLYFFDGNQVKRLTKYRTLGGTSDTDAPGGITIPSSPTYYATPNFVIMRNSSNALVAVSKDGKVIKEDSGVSSVNTTCEAVTKSGADYKLNADGTSSSTTIPTTLASAGGKYLVQHPSNNKIYLSSDGCSASGVEVATISGVNDAKMVKVVDSNNNPHFFIAVRTSASSNKELKYYRVTGDTPTLLNTITLNTAGKNYYALDGKGRLYANISDANTVAGYNVDGTSLNSVTVTNVAGLLGLADRALAKDGSNAYEITTTSSGVNSVNKGGGDLFTALNRCTDATNTKAIDGAGTNFIRCVYESGGTRVLYSLTYDSGSGLYGNASYNLPAAFNDVRWATNKALVQAGSAIYLCNTTTTPTITCNNTDLPALDPTDINSYLKFNGNNVFYLSSSTPKVGDIFGTISSLPIAVNNATGGNASFDLTKFAFSFKPGGATCNTQILYFSSTTSSTAYALPSGTCVERILKVY